VHRKLQEKCSKQSKMISFLRASSVSRFEKHTRFIF
jgi:hypothetical protein